MKTRGAGEGKLFAQGEIGDVEFSGKGGLLRISFSGDSASLSTIRMSDLILCAKGGRVEGEGEIGETGKGRFLALGVLADKTVTACRR